MAPPLSTVVSSGRCLAKELLAQLCPKGEGLDAYRSFLASSERDDTSHLLLSRLPDEKLAEFFRLARPDMPPMFFDFSHDKLAMLELALSTNIVVTRRMRYDTFKVHDRRVYGLGERLTRFFVLSSKEGKGRNKNFGLTETSVDYSRLRSESHFMRRRSELAAGSCLVQKVGDVLGVESGFHHQHGDWCRATTSFAVNARRAACELGKGFVLVSHVGSRVNENSLAPKDQTFAVLAVAMMPGEKLSQLDVVAVTGGCPDDEPDVYAPNADQAEWILSHERHRKPKMAGRLMDLFDDDNVKTNTPSRGNAAAASTVVTAMTEDCDFTTTTARPPVGCQCEPCRGASAFNDVMSEAGPQKPYHIRLGVEEHLSFLGLDTVDNLKRVRTACDWSVASFDVEAANLTLDRRSTESDVDFDVGVVSEERLRGRILGRQVPIMISWTDQRAMEAGLDPWVHEYDEANHEAMIAEFVGGVMARREESEAAKRELLAPLFEAVETLRQAHVKFFPFRPAVLGEDQPGDGTPAAEMLSRSREEEREKHDKAIGASFAHSAVGLLGAALVRLVRVQLLVGFNCASYDTPIIADMLVSHLKTRSKMRVRMQREGTRIKSLSFGGCKIVDVRKLLADSGSLSSFARMVGLEEHKVREGLDDHRLCCCCY